MRTANTDMISTMRFHVNAQMVGTSPTDPLQVTDATALGDRAMAGFTTCTVPEVSTEPVEYKEGLFTFPRKYPGAPTIGDVSLARGVARRDNTFWSWMQLVVRGGGEYRADVVTIKHYGREAMRGGAVDPRTAVPSREYYAKNCFPTRHKIAGDFDATSSEISVMELDLAVEDMDVNENPAGPGG